jgi:Ni,Fe-hydrogenase maturation factor
MTVEFINDEVINVDAEEVNSEQAGELIKVDFDKLPVQLSVTDVEIARMKQYKALTIVDINDKTGYNVVDLRRKEVKKTRTALAKYAEEKRSPAKAYIDKVKAEEKRIIAELEDIEADLEAKQKVINDEKERIRIEDEKRAAEKLQARVNTFSKYTVNEINLDYLKALSDADFEAVIADMKAAWEQAEEEKRQAAEALKLQQEENEQLKKELEKQKKSALLPPTPEPVVDISAPVSEHEAANKQVIPSTRLTEEAQMDKRKLTLFLSRINSIEIPILDDKENEYAIDIASDHLHDAASVIELLISKI